MSSERMKKKLPKGRGKKNLCCHSHQFLLGRLLSRSPVEKTRNSKNSAKVKKQDSKGALPHPISACLYRNALHFFYYLPWILNVYGKKGIT